MFKNKAVVLDKEDPFKGLDEYEESMQTDGCIPADGTKYQALVDKLRATNDSYNNIKSGLNDKNEWVRDASGAEPLNSKRASPDSPKIEINNMLMRCLSRLRPINFAISKKIPGPSSQNMDDEFGKFYNEALNILNNTGLTDKKKLKAFLSIEKKFNGFLVKQLHEAGLTRGTEKDPEALLFHYRNLSSVLTPARTMITLTYDENNKVLTRETQYPITTKTEKQKTELAKLKTIGRIPYEEKSVHNTSKQAMQEADAYFADLIADDSRTLSAQARKTHADTCKNGFIVKCELITDVGKEFLVANKNATATSDNTLWLARTGSPVYPGEKETKANVLEQTKENLKQIQMAAREKKGETVTKLHITTLNTRVC